MRHCVFTVVFLGHALCINAGEAWNEVLFGSKRWFMFPPAQPPTHGYNPFKDTSAWLRATYDRLDEADWPHECVSGRPRPECCSDS